jgi:HAD superfamily hydrolase (TIGR01509 family)
MKYDAVLFDLDGTLVETTHLYEQAYAQALAEQGVTLTHEQFCRFFPTGWPLERWLQEFGVEERLGPSIRERRDVRYIELLRARVCWREGAEELLRHLSPRHPIGIVTGSWHHFIEALSVRTDIRRYAKTIVTADHMQERRKPDPYGLLLAAEELGADPRHCIYIGDQPYDLQAAASAGMASCLVPGTYTPPAIEKPADFIAGSLREVRQILETYSPSSPRPSIPRTASSRTCS